MGMTVPKDPAEKKYVIILRNNAAIDVACTDVYTKPQWIEFKDAHGILVMAVPIDIILMITTPERFVAFQRAAEDERVRQEILSTRGIPNIDPVATLDPSIAQP